MTVFELIEELKKYPPNIEVGIASDRGAVAIPTMEISEIRDLNEKEKKYNYNKSCFSIVNFKLKDNQSNIRQALIFDFVV